MRILVTGGGGYIGSFISKALLDKNYEVIVLDNLERGHETAIDKRAKFIKGDIKNPSDIESLFVGNTVDVIMHFAGYISVEESTKNPTLYEKNNVIGSKNLFDCAIRNGVSNFIFSSSAAVYGNPIKTPIPEDHPTNPTSVYGATKLKTEEYLSFLKKANPSVSYACLRYFNACGAAVDGLMGEDHVPETHIIPLAIKSILENKEFLLYGSDYNTPDGTCIRDYIHVLDLVDAHILAMEKILSKKDGYIYNVGTGKGYSNKEIVNVIENVAGKKMNIEYVKRRDGDADVLVADPTRIKNELGFNPIYSDLENIIKTAWQWHSRKN